MQDNDLLFFDIEADNLLLDATNIWCIVGYYNNRYHIYFEPDESIRTPPNSIVYNNLDTYVEFMREKKLVGHNIISYDLPLVKKLTDFEYEINQDKIVDTHILSRLYYPDREGHSLAWWGDKLRFKKGDHCDWTCFSQEMLDYCIRDVDVTRRVYYTLLGEGKDWDWTEAIKLEYYIWDIQVQQELRGVCFDSVRAEEILAEINKEISAIEAEVIPKIPMRPSNDGELKKIFLKSGEYTEPVKEWMNVDA
jgi:DNA polymerase III alpha subunit (gram-positive type)